MKFAVSTYSFSQLVCKGEMTYLDCIAKAKEMGFDGVEVASCPDEGVMEFAQEVAREAKRCGIEITNVAFGADFIHGSNGDTKAEIQRVKEMIDAAAVMGAPSVRHDVLYSLEKVPSFAQALPVLADACREVTEYAQTKGVYTMSENHGFISQDSIRVEQLFNAVNHPNFKLLVDMGNFLCADEDPVTAVSRVAPYAGYVHAKDFLFKSGSEPNPGKNFFETRGGNYLRGTVIGHGCVPVQQCLAIVKKAGYDGYVSVEYEGMEPVLEGIAAGLENLKRYEEAVRA